ncbi:AMP-binding protein [Amycolatopsis magusensis]|uniref:AMP-binding protein n=1 Tax=Amycolatopsis magusensis TaxID=882444 RepID=UPI0037BBB8C3
MQEETIGGLVERVALAYGPRTAVVTGGQRITYREQLGRIRRAGRALLGLGLDTGDRVAILMSDRPELLDVYYGALWAGLAVVPLNSRLGVADHQYIVCDSAAEVLVHDAVHARRVQQIRGTSGVEHVVSVDDDAVLTGGHSWQRLSCHQPDHPGAPTVFPSDLYGIYYTAGTTGQPKGVVHTHRTVLAALFSQLSELGLDEGDRFAHVTPLSHAAGAFVLPVWLRGGTNVLAGRFDPGELVDTIARERITATLLSPDMLAGLMDAAPAAGAKLLSLTTVVYSGGRVEPERLLAAMDRFGPVFVQFYGLTEVPNQVTVLRKRDHAAAVATGNPGPLSSCGRPVAIADVRIEHPDGGQARTGERGEVVVGGPHVMLRYWNRYADTERALRGGHLYTGDTGHFDEGGFLHLADRQRETIRSAGVTVYPKQVEAGLITHPAVRDACVFGAPDDRRGEVVHAVVVADPDATVCAEDLISWVAERGGEALAPRRVDFVDAIPLTEVGKHDRPRLRGRAS